MQSNSAFLGEQIILPASLRRPLPKLDCSRVDTAVQPPFLHSQRSKDDLSSLEGRALFCFCFLDFCRQRGGHRRFVERSGEGQDRNFVSAQAASTRNA